MPDTLTLQDQQPRDVIANDLDTNLVVLAGAGAGKTYALVQRMVNVVKAGKAPVGKLVAITFTRKAAGEMRARVNLWLQDEARKATGAEKKRLQQALQQSDQCYIGTIHSFCGRLLGERPIDAGLSPDFQEMDDREEQQLRRAAWDRYVLQAYRDDDSIFEIIDEVGLEIEDLFPFYEQRCLLSDLPLKETPAEAPDLETAIAEVQKLYAQARTFSGEIAQTPDTFYKQMEMAARFEQNRGLDSLADQAAFLEIAADGLKDGKLKYTKWGKNNAEWKAQAKELRDALVPEVRDAHVVPALEAWRNYLYARVAPWIEGVVAAFQIAKEEAGKLGFSDLLERATAMLRDSPDARRFFQQRYTHLFVDEFQDTDPVQAQMLFYLTGTDRREMNWRTLTPRPGSLFIVGDGKQSIYRFRRADVELFREVCDLVVEAGGKQLVLTTSFRSYGALCGWLIRAFEPLFAEDREAHQEAQAPFAPLIPVKGEGADPHGVRTIAINREKGERAGDVRAQEADRVATTIERCLAGTSALNGTDDDAPVDTPARPGDFLILTRRTKSLAPFARALEQRGIPYDVVGGEALIEVPTVKALLTLLEVAFQPENPVHYLNYLRGALVGLSDPELLAFAQAEGSFSMDASVTDVLPEELHERIAAARQTALEARELLFNHTPSAALERLIDGTGLGAYHAFEESGTTRAGSLARLTSMVRQWEADGWHWGRIVRELRALRDEQGYKQDGMTLDAGRGDVVRLMNLHQVKGLQARVVFLVDCYDNSGGRHSPDWHVARTAEPPYAAIPIRKQTSAWSTKTVGEPAGWPEDEAREEAFLEAEKLRLVYVGATRAENMLIVTQCPGATHRGPWKRLTGALDEVPMLEAPAAPELALRSGDGAAPGLATLETVRASRQQALAAAQRPSYTRRAAGSEKPRGLLTDATAGSGRGRDYGTLVHELFEARIDGHLPDDWKPLVTSRCQAADLSEKAADAAVRALQILEASALFADLQVAAAVYTEIPFASASVAADLPTLTSGIIDLAYRDADGWHLVDYKTDVTTADEARQKGYLAQLNTYATYWEELTGEAVASRSVYATQTGERVVG